MPRNAAPMILISVVVKITAYSQINLPRKVYYVVATYKVQCSRLYDDAAIRLFQRRANGP